VPLFLRLFYDDTYSTIVHTKKRRKSNSTGHVWHTNCLLQHVIEKENCKGREDEKEDVSIYWIALRKREDIGIEKGIIISHAVENALWKNVDLS